MSKYTDSPLFKRLLAAETALGASIGIEESAARDGRIGRLADYAEAGGRFDSELHLELLNAMAANLNYIEGLS